ncbi:MAG: hypothetical protein JWP01_1224 [Myxococcales bacterium]|nr:hypothetical protein [Myxococcales bacterium]
MLIFTLFGAALLAAVLRGATLRPVVALLLRRVAFAFAFAGAGFFFAAVRVAFDVDFDFDFDFDFVALDLFATDLSSHQIEPTVNAGAASALG